jgi:O-antigen ligase
VGLKLLKQVSKSGLLALPGALVVYFGFNAGGFFPNTPAFVAVFLAALLALRAVFADEPFEGISRAVLVAAGALGLYAIWTLASATWSDSLGRSMIEFNLVLLYLFGLLLFGSLARSSDCVRWMLRGLALGILIVCVSGLITRVLPDVWTVAPNISQNRLSYPITYWNALGILASLGLILCLHLTCSLHEPRLIRPLAAGAITPLAATLLFTFSRGGIGAGAVGLAAYVVLARPRGLVTGLLAAGPTTAIALITSYNADLLATDNPTSVAATAQGHHVAVVVALCSLAAIAIRAVLLIPDRWFARARFPLSRSTTRTLLTASGVVMVVILLAAGAPGDVKHQYNRFVKGSQNIGTAADLRTRLTDPGNNGRIDQWKAAIKGFDRAPMHGQGAGTYSLTWAKERPNQTIVVNAHSLYTEVLSELGLVGLALLGFVILMIGAGTLTRSRRRNRTVYRAILAAGIAWALHAGLDWDWEMPVVTFWLFALGGNVLATNERQTPLFSSPAIGTRAAVAVSCLGVAIMPALVFASQTRLDQSLQAFHHGDCTKAIDKARSSSSALGSRAEPFEVIAYCEASLGHPRRGLRAMDHALERDPHNWEFHYGRAVMRAASGLDPRHDARIALRLNPLDPITNDAIDRFRTANRSLWRQRAGVLVTRAFQ